MNELHKQRIRYLIEARVPPEEPATRASVAGWALAVIIVTILATVAEILLR